MIVLDGPQRLEMLLRPRSRRSRMPQDNVFGSWLPYRGSHRDRKGMYTNVNIQAVANGIASWIAGPKVWCISLAPPCTRLTIARRGTANSPKDADGLRVRCLPCAPKSCVVIKNPLHCASHSSSRSCQNSFGTWTPKERLENFTCCRISTRFVQIRCQARLERRASFSLSSPEGTCAQWTVVP